MDEQLIREIVTGLLAKQETAGGALEIPIEVSARHVHLSKDDVERLFGSGYSLKAKKELSQPGQFLCEERVKLVTSKGELANVAILGPARGKTQVELSQSDAYSLGISPPLRLSGDLSGAEDLLLVSPMGFAYARGSVIIAQNHIHASPADAASLGIADGENVRVAVAGGRPLTFENVPVRVSETFRLAMHIDFDEANACLACCGVKGRLLGAGASFPGVPAEIRPAKPAPATKAVYDCEEAVITEAIAKKLSATGKAKLVLPLGSILTPLAKDIFASQHIQVEKEPDGRGHSK